MSSVNVTNCRMSRNDKTVEGSITFEVNFTETETRMDMGFTVGAVVAASSDSTANIVITTANLYNPIKKEWHETTTFLKDRRKQVSVVLPTVKPSGQRKVVFTAPFTFAVTDLFDSSPLKKYDSSTVYRCGEEAALWTAPNLGLEVFSLTLQPEFSGSTAPYFAPPPPPVIQEQPMKK